MELRALQRLLVDRQLYEPYTVEQSLLGDAELRRDLARALGQILDPRTVSPLTALLQDPSVPVRRAAAFALGEQEAVEDTRSLEMAARDPDQDVGRLAVEALGKWRVPLDRVEQALVGLSETEAWERLLPSLFRFEESRAVNLAVQARERSRGEDRRWAAYALARTPRPEGLAAVRLLLEDGSTEVQGWAARALGRIGTAEDLARLRVLLEAVDPLPVIQALRAGPSLVQRLGLAAPEGWRAPLRELIDDPRPAVAETAIAAAATWLRDESLSPRLVAIARQPSDTPGMERRRELALTALVAGAEPEAVELVESFSRSERAGLRATAAAGAAELGLTDVVERLALDPEPRVRMALLSSTLEAGSEEDGALHARLAFTDADPMVRSVALSWLAKHPLVSYEAILVALGEAWNERAPDARIAAIEALEARAEAAPDERDAIVLALLEMADHPEYLLRRPVVEAIRALEGEAPPLGSVEPRVRVTSVGGDLKTVPVGGPFYQDILVAGEDHPRVRLATEHGRVELELHCAEAPLTCHSFLHLASQGFYDGLRFHRVVPGFVVQGGDPRGDGWGGPGYTIRDEINRLRFERGVLGMAHSGPHTAGSQFFITLSPQPHLDGGYTAFGRVLEGFEVLERIRQGDRILTIRQVGGQPQVPLSSRGESHESSRRLQPSQPLDVVTRGRGTH